MITKRGETSFCTAKCCCCCEKYSIILAVRKVGHLNIKTKLFDFEARVLIGWLANILASQPIRTRASKSNIFVFMLRWPTFLTASIGISVSVEKERDSEREGDREKQRREGERLPGPNSTDKGFPVLITGSPYVTPLVSSYTWK